MQQFETNEWNSGKSRPRYIVLQESLLEESSSSGAQHLTKLEALIQAQWEKGYRLHTITTESSEVRGRRMMVSIRATLVFELRDEMVNSVGR